VGSLLSCGPQGYLSLPASVIWPAGVFPRYKAGPGWDPVTGRGSPDAAVLVPLPAHGG